MTIRNPTEAEREGISTLRVDEIKASYGRGLPPSVVWGVVVLVLAAAAAGIAVALI